MKWVLSDGTEVYLGGRVRGSSKAADALKQDVFRMKRGGRVDVQVEPCPGASEDLDLDNPQLVNLWIRQEIWRFDVTVVEAPELPPLPRRPAEDVEPDEDGRQRIY